MSAKKDYEDAVVRVKKSAKEKSGADRAYEEATARQKDASPTGMVLDVMRCVFLRAAAHIDESLKDSYDRPRGVDRDLLEKQKDEYERLAKCCEEERAGTPMPDTREPWEK